MIKRTLLFLLINFGALAIASYFTGPGVTSDWYVNLNKAPWTPPGWVFGAAWSTIMICFSIYMADIWARLEKKQTLIRLYCLQLILNIVWSPLFFYFHTVTIALVVIAGLTAVLGYFIFHYWSEQKLKTALLLPYFIWLLIATSLNGYVLFFN